MRFLCLGIHSVCFISLGTRSSAFTLNNVRRTLSPIVANMSSTSAPATPAVSGRIRQTLDPCVVLMKELIGKYAEQWEDKGGIYSLAQGVVYWKPPPAAMKAVKEALDDEASMLHMYGPDEGLPEFRKALQTKIAVENGLTKHDVMVTVGANQAFVNCVLTLLEQHHKAVVFAPYYFNHVMALQMTLPESALLVGPVCDNGIPDLNWLEEQLKQDSDIHMVTLVNPGNPTGTCLPRDYVQDMVDLCHKYDCWLILDVTYEYFMHPADGEQAKVFESCFNEPHVIHIFSLSKSYALAGYRCGYLALHQDAPGLYEQMLKVQDTIPIAPSRIAQTAGLGAIEGAGREWVQEKVTTLETGRQAILDAIQCLDQPIIGGSGAMYLMVKLPTEDDLEVGTVLVRDYGVAVIPGSFCGFPGWIRVCYSNLPPQECLKAAKRLKAGLQSLR